MYVCTVQVVRQREDAKLIPTQMQRLRGFVESRGVHWES